MDIQAHRIHGLLKDAEVPFHASGLKGTLSQSLGNLSLLCTFNLSANCLARRIPPEFGQVKALRLLDLRHNSIAIAPATETKVPDPP
jgi:hypothetical protein